MRSMRPPCHSSNTLDIFWSSWHRDMIDTWCILQFGWFCWSPGNQPDVFARQDIYLDIVGFQPHQAQERAAKLLSWVSTPMYRFLIPVFDHQDVFFNSRRCCFHFVWSPSGQKTLCDCEWGGPVAYQKSCIVVVKGGLILTHLWAGHTASWQDFYIYTYTQ